MKLPLIKIGIAGTHSTGKSTFLDALAESIEEPSIRVGRISGIATKAQDLGFPILANHTFESTLWVMAEGMRQEVEGSLTCDVILVDRPVLDALGYFRAALEITGRTEIPQRMEELSSIAKTHTNEYDLLIGTSLDSEVPMGDDRDKDQVFRLAAANHIADLISDYAPEALELTPANSARVLRVASEFVRSNLNRNMTT